MNTDKKIIIILVVITLLILVGGVFLLSNQSSSTNPTESAGTLNNLVGKPAPDFTLESYNGEKITLSSLKGKNVILFFNEGLACYPACWNQIAAFGTDKEFGNKNTVVLSIVNDRKDDWKGAVDKMPELAQATVLLDSDKKASESYNTLFLPSSMHKGQLSGHTYIIVDKDGIVRLVKDDPQMGTRNQELLTEISKF